MALTSEFEVPDSRVETYCYQTPVRVDTSVITDQKEIDNLAAEYPAVRLATNMKLLPPSIERIRVEGGKLSVFSPTHQEQHQGAVALYQTSELILQSNSGRISFLDSRITEYLTEYLIGLDGSVKIDTRSTDLKPGNFKPSKSRENPLLLAIKPFGVNARLLKEPVPGQGQGQDQDQGLTKPVLEFVRITPFTFSNKSLKGGLDTNFLRLLEKLRGDEKKISRDPYTLKEPKDTQIFPEYKLPKEKLLNPEDLMGNNDFYKLYRYKKINYNKDPEEK